MLHSYPIPFHHDSAELFSKFSDLPMAAWLDSNSEGTDSRYDIICAQPDVSITVYSDRTELKRNGIQTNHTGQCPFELIQLELDKLPPATGNELPFCGGLLGFFAYELGLNLPFNQVNANTKKLAASSLLASLGIYHWSIVQDRDLKKSYFCCFDSVDETTRHKLIATATGFQPTDNSSHTTGTFYPTTAKSRYLSDLKSIDAYIHAGDCYQVNYTQRFSADFSGNSLSAYKLLRRKLPSPYSAYLKLDHGAVLCHSPEQFIKLKSGKISTKPIKGTAPRDSNPQQDLANATSLQTSAKDKAENLMIVDLMRNDIGRSSINGSVQVPSLFALESFRNVHHLVSTITADISPNTNPLQLFKNCFPGGSITGAPKRRSMEIIEELEITERSAYCGSIGYISACGNMNTNIAIRTLLDNGKGKIHCWAGGGIVADSIAENEYQECLSKVGVLLNALSELAPEPEKS